MDIMKDLESTCEVVSEQLGDMVRKIKNNGMTSGDLETLDKLTHTLASVKKTMKMEEDGEYSGYYPMGGVYARDGGSYNRGDGSYNRGSYARGRMNARRDSMGRYSGERGYSRNDLADKMRELMDEAPDDRTRQDIQRMVEKLENA